MRSYTKHSARKQSVRQGRHPDDHAPGLAGIAKYRSELSTNRTAVGSAGADTAAKMTGKTDLGKMSYSTGHEKGR